MTSGSFRDERRQEPSGAPGASKPDPGGSGGLTIVATPIGNLGDITLRALEVLRGADLILCEDTRVTGKLAARHGIAARREAFNEHNAAARIPSILDRLRGGARIALVSDAGTPLVSDPGWDLVRAAIDAGLPVTTTPGPSAPIAALALSGLPAERFLVAGFLPPRAAARQAALAGLKAVPATLLFLEAPHRLAESLADMASVLGDRPAAVARELTKLHEEVRRAPLPALAAHYAAHAARGEIVVVVGPPPPEAAPAGDDLDALLRAALRSMSIRDAAASVAAATGLPRRQVYNRALALGAGEE